jgi:hypothetical protein
VRFYVAVPEAPRADKALAYLSAERDLTTAVSRIMAFVADDPWEV